MQSLRDVPFSESAERTINLPDVDVETGHVIVHFLYTGQYQTLPYIEEESGPSHSRADFKKAISAFIAAKNYKLTALQELARTEVSKCGENIGILQAAHAIGKDTLSALQEDAVWLQDLILKKADQAFENNDEIFSSTSFFSGIKSHKLAKLLGRHVAKLYHRLFEDLDAEISKFKASIADHEARSKDGYRLMEKSVSPSMASPNEVHENEQSAHSPTKIETSADHWSFGISKKQKQKAARMAEEGWSGTQCWTVPPAEPEPAAETATEQAVNTALIEDAPPDTSDPVKETAESIVDRADSEDPWAFSSTWAGTEKKKKQKKNQVTASGEEAPKIEVGTLNTTERSPVTDPASLGHSLTDTAHDEPLETPVEAVNDPVLDPITAIEDSPVLVEPPLTSQQHDQWGIWGASLGSSKKKKKKKGKAVRIEAPQPPPTPPPAAETDIVANGDLIEPEYIPEPECIPESEYVPKASPEPEQRPEQESHSAPAVYEVTVPVDIEPSDDNKCLSLYEHLTQNDEWRNCQECKSYMHKIAIKLQQEKQRSIGW